MDLIVSKKNGCTYILNHNEDLLYHPIMANGKATANLEDYIYVDIEELDEDVQNEAIRCHSILMESLEE